jgi:HD-GYP domain-containing protein (c-di-GMP phosphodiesterase class II)
MGLSGDEIPLAARIITLADVLDAMVSKRPYGQPMSFTAARARLKELKGSVLDPQVVEAFDRAFEAGEFASEERWSARLQNGEGDLHEEEPSDEDTLTRLLTSESADVPAGAVGS